MAEPVPTTPEQFGDFMKAELAKYEKVVKASGAKGGPRLLPRYAARTFRVVEHFAGVTGHGDFAGLHHVAAVGDAQGAAGVLLHQQDGHALAGNVAHPRRSCPP